MDTAQMEQTTQNTNSYSLKKMLMHPPMKAVLGLVGVAVVVLLIGIIVVASNKSSTTSTSTKPSTSTKGNFAEDQKIAKIGTEVIYGSDINFTINFFYPLLNTNKSTNDQLKKAALEKIQEDSILLQEEQKLNPSVVTKTIFNSLGKDQLKRQQLVQKIKAQFENKQQSYSGEQLSVWYYNVRPPRLSETEAKQLALDTINAIYQDLVTKKITVQQAKDKIVNNPKLAKIDFNYKGNAYSSFTNITRSNPIFTFSALNDALFAMKQTGISKVINVTSNKDGFKEELYSILIVNEIENSQIQTYNDWLTQKRKQYAIQYL